MKKATAILAALIWGAGSFCIAQEAKGILVAVGYNGFMNSTNYYGAIYYSEDFGETWNLAWNTDAENFLVKDVIYVKELKRFIAIASYDPGGYYTGAGSFLLLFSSDGKQWEKARPALDFDNARVAYVPRTLSYGDGLLVAVAPGHCIVYSSDGKKWHHILEDENGSSAKEKMENWQQKATDKGAYQTIAYVGGRFLVTGFSHQALFLKAQDGKLAFDALVENNSEQIAKSIGWDGNDTVVILGSMNYDYVSKDRGKTWRKINGLWKYDINSVVYAEGKFVAGCNTGQIIYSKDGKKWEEASLTPFRAYFIWKLTHGAGKFFAVRSYANMAEILVSDDGVTWEALECQLTDKEGVFMNFMAVEYAELD